MERRPGIRRERGASYHRSTTIIRLATTNERRKPLDLFQKCAADDRSSTLDHWKQQSFNVLRRNWFANDSSVIEEFSIRPKHLHAVRVMETLISGDPLTQ